MEGSPDDAESMTGQWTVELVDVFAHSSHPQTNVGHLNVKLKTLLNK